MKRIILTSTFLILLSPSSGDASRWSHGSGQAHCDNMARAYYDLKNRLFHTDYLPEQLKIEIKELLEAYTRICVEDNNVSHLPLHGLDD